MKANHLIYACRPFLIFVITTILSTACQHTNSNDVPSLGSVDSLDQERTVKPEISRFVSVDGQFSIQFPGVPKTNESSSPTEIGVVDVTQYIYSVDDKQVWIASFADYSNEMMKQGSTLELINGIQTDILDGLEAKELNSRHYMFDDQFESKTMSAYSKRNAVDILYTIILVENRIYQLGMFSSIGPFSVADSIDFMSSFKLDL